MFPLILIIVATAVLSLAMLMVLGSLLRSGIGGVREWFGANLAMVAALFSLEPSVRTPPRPGAEARSPARIVRTNDAS